MQRRLRPALTSLSLGAALLFGGGTASTLMPAGSARAQAPAASTSAPGPVLSIEQARLAAQRILEAQKAGDANARYAQFSDELQAVSSPSMVQATMRSQPKVLSYELLSVRSGVSTSTVEAELTTTAGKRTVFIVLNGQGRIARFYVDRADDPSSKVAAQFMQAISGGQFITAHSFLSPQFQKDITPQALQAKWLNLQRITGSFVKLGRVVEAESNPDGRLVLVNVQFNRLSDNVFVILNTSNQVTGVDFPAEPNAPQPAR
ncbi:MAG: DUF3887 domain-containing protein [Vulcanococcus sp.]